MDEITFDTLEWPRIQSRTADFCFSEEGRSALLSANLVYDDIILEELRKPIRDFLKILEQGEHPSPGLLPAVGEFLELLAPEGAVLEGRQLKDLGNFLSGAGAVKEFLSARPEPFAQEWAHAWPDLTPLTREIHFLLDSEGKVKEDHPSLRSIRRSMDSVRGEIDTLAKSYLSGGESRDWWQNDRPTVRGGRVVLALKTNFKGRVKGIIHEASGSGATVFMEPMDLMDRNNRYMEAQEEYQREIFRLLKELSGKVHEKLPELLILHPAFLQWDGLWARAAVGASWKGALIPVSRDRSGDLRDARHPLLGEKAVPIHLDWEDSTRTLLISGPNTGGKTVTLKTAGLFVLMNQWGLPLPCSEISTLPLYDSVWTDIGDRQNIDAALSTYSSHLKRIGDIFHHATDSSLVLLDELGTGTDPREGGVLGQAFLEEFLKKNIQVLVTTHHSGLKNLAYSTPGMKNASVEFDQNLGRPTYRILPGIPGSSHALEIAQGVGVSQQLVDRARSLLKAEEGEAGELLKRLREDQKALETRFALITAKEQEVNEARRAADLLRLRLKQKEVELRTLGLGEMNHFLKDSRSVFENLVKQIREGKLTPEGIKEAREFFLDTEGKILSQKAQLDADQRELDKSEGLGIDTPLEPGDEVMYEGNRGIVLHSAGKEKYVISVGILKITLPASKLQRAEGKRPKKVEIQTSDVDASGTPAFSLDLRGMREKEAMEALERQIDLAIIKGLGEFSIIHGLGEGILSRAVQNYLRSRKEVGKFFFSHPEEGGFGKTIVQLG